MAMEVILQDQNSHSNLSVRILDENASVKRLTNAIVNALKLPISNPTKFPIIYHLSHNGRRLQDNETLISANVQPGDTITIVPDRVVSDHDENENVETFKDDFLSKSYNELTDNLPQGVRLRQTITLNSEQQATIPQISFPFSRVATELLGSRETLLGWSPSGDFLAAQKILTRPNNSYDKALWVENIRAHLEASSRLSPGIPLPPPQGPRKHDEPGYFYDEMITGLSWSLHNDILAYSTHKEIFLWDVAREEIQRTALNPAGVIVNLALSPTGETLAYATNENIWLWNIKTHQHDPLLIEYADRPTELAWSPDGEMLMVGSSNQNLQLWDAKTRTLRQEFEGHMGNITSIVWSPDANIVASASDDRTIRIWDMRTERQYVLEGHNDSVVSLAFAPNGRLLASQSADGTILLWRSDIWQTIAAMHEPGIQEPGLVFHPQSSTLATFGEDNSTIHIWDINLATLFGMALPESSIYYRNAKVALVGDPGVGKSGLRLVLTGNLFRDTPPTHPCQVGLFDSWEVKLPDGNTETREIYLWDLAGQPGYRITHQFHLHELAVALIVFDSRSETDPFAGVDYWNHALNQASRVQGASKFPLKKFLVAARIDVEGIAAGEERIKAVIKDLTCDGYFPTSAKKGKNISKLRQAIYDAIDWGDTFVRVSSTTLFLQIKRFLIEQKNVRHCLELSSALYTTFCKSAHPPLDHTSELRRHFDTCIHFLERMDLIRTFCQHDLVLLKPELLDIYGSALINAMKFQPDSMGTISIEKVHHAEFYIPLDKRIADKEQEYLLLQAMVTDLLSKEIAFNEHFDYESILIFPAQATREKPEAFGLRGKTVIFAFNGSVVIIYTTLLVRLSRTDTFIEGEFWKNAATYTTREGGKYSLFLENTGEGSGKITLFFESTDNQRRYEFEDFAREHLKRKAENVHREHIIRCLKCEEDEEGEFIVASNVVQRCLKKGMTKVTCHVCKTEISLLDDPIEFTLSRQTTTLQMNEEADKQRDIEVQSCAVPISIHLHLNIEQNNQGGNTMSQHNGDEIRISTGDITSHGSNIILGSGDIVLNAAEQDRLANALAAVREAVASSQALSLDDKEDHIGIVTQVTEETTKKKPNRVLLQGLLDALKRVPDVASAVTSLVPVLHDLHILK